MEDVAGRGLECQKIMDGKNDDTNGSDKAVIPSCCLKALGSTPELEDKRHSTTVSGWFSGDYYIFLLCFYVFYFLLLFDYFSYFECLVNFIDSCCLLQIIRL